MEIAPKANQEGMVLRSMIQPGVHVLGDSLRLRQLITNLLSNAVRYSPSETEVTLSLATCGSSAELTVADQGEGISSEKLDIIFECFHQGGDNHKQGLGLGLSLVRGFTRMHGGTVRAESAGLGQGARFIVDLPLAPS